MGGVVKNMDKAMASMNLEAISSTMDKFEQQFEDLDLRAEYMDNAIGSSSALTTPDDQVQSLMHQVADEHNLEFQSNLNAVGVGKAKPQQVEEKEDDDLEERLKRLQVRVSCTFAVYRIDSASRRGSDHRYTNGIAFTVVDCRQCRWTTRTTTQFRGRFRRGSGSAAGRRCRSAPSAAVRTGAAWRR